MTATRTTHTVAEAMAQAAARRRTQTTRTATPVAAARTAAAVGTATVIKQEQRVLFHDDASLAFRLASILANKTLGTFLKPKLIFF